MKFIYIASIPLLFLFSCKSARTISVTSPAEITFPKEVQKFIIINNAQHKVDKSKNVFEGVLTGEQLGLDKRASKRFINSLARQIVSNSSYVLDTISNVDLITNGGINWHIVDSICTSREAQVVIVLESFDSDALPGAGAVLTAGVNRVDGTAIMSIYHPAGRWDKSGIRVMDTHRFQSSGSINPLDIMVDVTHKRDVVLDLADGMGYKASAQVVPHSFRAHRTYYKGGSKDLRKSKRLIWYSNWDLAAERYSKLSREGSTKQKARATFNLALVNEARGDLNEALRLAKYCASEYNLKPAYQYMNILKARIKDNEVLNAQLNPTN